MVFRLSDYSYNLHTYIYVCVNMCVYVFDVYENFDAKNEAVEYQWKSITMHAYSYLES